MCEARCCTKLLYAHLGVVALFMKSTMRVMGQETKRGNPRAETCLAFQTLAGAGGRAVAQRAPAPRQQVCHQRRVGRGVLRQRHLARVPPLLNPTSSPSAAKDITLPQTQQSPTFTCQQRRRKDPKGPDAPLKAPDPPHPQSRLHQAAACDSAPKPPAVQAAAHHDSCGRPHQLH